MNSSSAKEEKKEPGPAQVAEGIKGLEESVTLRIAALPLYLRQRMRGETIRTTKHWASGLFDNTEALQRAVI